MGSTRRLYWEVSIEARHKATHERTVVVVRNHCRGGYSKIDCLHQFEEYDRVAILKGIEIVANIRAVNTGMVYHEEKAGK